MVNQPYMICSLIDQLPETCADGYASTERNMRGVMTSVTRTIHVVSASAASDLLGHSNGSECHTRLLIHHGQVRYIITARWSQVGSQ